MPNKILSLLLFFLINQSAFSRGDEVGNGAGLYENKVQEVFSKIDLYIEEALVNTSFNEVENEILVKILDSKSTWKTQTKFSFLPQSELFFVDNEYRIALTGNLLNSPILFNIDKLYSIPVDDLHLTLISLLVHELGHKMGELNHFLLDQIGVQVASNVFESHTIFYTNIMERNEFIEVFRYFDNEKSDSIIYTTITSIYNLSKIIEEKNVCVGNHKGFNFHFDKETSIFEGLILIECHNPEESLIKTIQIKKIHGLLGETIKVDLVQ